MNRYDRIKEKFVPGAVFSRPDSKNSNMVLSISWETECADIIWLASNGEIVNPGYSFSLDDLEVLEREYNAWL